MANAHFDQVTEAAAFLKSRLAGLAPRIGIVLGSGLGAVADAVSDPIPVPYAEIPHFPQSTVEGHSGRIIAGKLGGEPVIVMQGRVHYYEGYTPAQVTFPMRVLGALGVRGVVLTNAAGGIREGYRIGQLVALSDHINFMGWNPLTGPNEPRFACIPTAGLRFFDMTEAYSKRLRALAREAAAEEGLDMDEGVYVATPGPSFETPAEIRAFRTLGATLVGMSTVPETIVARHMGI
jgi:purine-nucleoside phosphorylase